MVRRSVRCSFVVIMPMVLAGCLGCPICVTNETQECVCSGGEPGAQVCQDDGAGWTECDCGGDDDTGDDDTADDDTADDDTADDDTADDDTGDDDTGDDDTGDDDTGDDDTGDDDTGDDDTVDDVDDDGDGWSEADGDCDDGDPAIHPGAVDTFCDGLDADCSGAEHRVPADFATIQTAIDGSVHGDTVCVSAGTYPELIDFGGRWIHVVGVDGWASTVLDGQGQGPVVTFSNNEPAHAVLEGFTITGGVAALGGGVWIETASPTLTDLWIAGNTATDSGGGAAVDGPAAPTFTRVTLAENRAAAHGGGLYVYGSTVSMTDTLLQDNVSDDSCGGLWASFGSAVEMIGGGFVGNQAETIGGGCFSTSGPHSAVNIVVLDNHAGGLSCGSADCYFDSCILEGNSSESSSGAMRISWAYAEIHNSLFRGNSGHRGGGIDAYMNGAGPIQVFNTVFEDNYATTGGGAIRLDSAHMDLYNCVLVDNSAGEEGGAIALFAYHGAWVKLYNSILAGNEAGQLGGALRLNDSHHGSCTLGLSNVLMTGNSAGSEGGGASLHAGCVGAATVENSNAWNNLPDDYAGLADPTGVDGNLAVDPQLLDTSPPDAADWDLHLSIGSPLIDAGSALLSDPDGGPADIGAFGGTDAGSWDLDWDGYPSWWQPGPYDPVLHPPAGWDCDDRDDTVFPGSGC